MRQELVRHGCVVLGLFATVSLAVPGRATTSRTLEATFSSVANGWEKVERWKDNSTGFGAEGFPSDGRGDQFGQRATFFGTTRPHSSRFLLYYAPNWDTGSRSTPVLLVHGANQQADFAWANPGELGSDFCGASTCPSMGLMQYLDSRGYKVFALSFPHKNGDGYYWAEQIHDAIEIIKSGTGAAKVDVVAWSKGGFNARMYASSVRASWGTAYASNIRRLILIGTPNNGLDYAFRHGIIPSLGVYSECGGEANGAVAHDWLVCYGSWSNHPEWTYSSSWFPGTKQMLRRWDGTYGLPFEQDYYTTYYGGWGFVSHSDGINAFTASSLVSKLRSATVPSSVRVHMLCGNQNDIPLIHNEHTGTSDGLIFTSSCRSTVGITNHGGSTTLGVNHNELGWHSSAMAQIEAWLGAAGSAPEPS